MSFRFFLLFFPFPVLFCIFSSFNLFIYLQYFYCFDFLLHFLSNWNLKGTHDELLESALKGECAGIYANLWNMQLQHRNNLSPVASHEEDDKDKDKDKEAEIVIKLIWCKLNQFKLIAIILLWNLLTTYSLLNWQKIFLR